jgi:hypothetical protein
MRKMMEAIDKDGVKLINVCGLDGIGKTRFV